MAIPMHPATAIPRPSDSGPAPAPAPFTLTPRVFEKVWGGQRLARLGKVLADPQARYGESWELADMPSTSAGGAGGGSVRTLIASGPLAGRTLRDAIGVWGPALLGGANATPAGDFPLLVKFLDACENLSVQVHPSPAYAAGHPGAHLKTECWYILDAEPGSVIYKGLKPGVTRAAFSARARAGDAGIVNDLVAVPAVPGECHNLPSGTVHALGAGVLVAEVQTPSDTTYRLFDWGRKGRELHVEESLACAAFEAPPAPTKIGEGGRRARLVTTEFFTLDGVEVAHGARVAVRDDQRPACGVVTVLSGRAHLVTADRVIVPLSTGDTGVVPAACTSAVIEADETARVLIAGL